METKSTSVSETNPLSNLSFDEILALADDAWAQSTSLPGIDDGVKSHSGAGDPLHVSLEQQPSIIHGSSLDPQGELNHFWLTLLILCCIIESFNQPGNVNNE